MFTEINNNPFSFADTEGEIMHTTDSCQDTVHTQSRTLSALSSVKLSIKILICPFFHHEQTQCSLEGLANTPDEALLKWLNRKYRMSGSFQ